ncbi:PIPO, partial [Johnsongrass mosaic virus]|uniref:PIPO n=1 Tax=Johnsongrass mosaic virus TaxID=31742 RepID=UPI0002651308
LRKRYTSIMARAKLVGKITLGLTVVLYKEATASVYKTERRHRFRRNLQYISNAAGFRISRETSRESQLYFSETPIHVQFSKAQISRRHP